MAATIKCPKCGTEIELDEAIRGELEAKILSETKAKHDEEIVLLKQQQNALLFQKAQELEKIKMEITESARKEADEKVRLEYDTKIKATQQAVEAREKQYQDLQTQLLENTKQLREAKDAESKLQLQYEQKLMEEQGKIKLNAKKEAEDELNLRIAQKDKQLADLQIQLQDAQRKAQQGSQQLQGEVLELALEDQLRTKFIYDEIKEVPKGITGADVVQTVNTTTGVSCGMIVWESKNTRIWSEPWIAKLKTDTRTLKADIAVIVSAVLPEGISSFGLRDGVWVCDRQTAVALACALRDRIIAVRSVQEANKGKETKAEVVFNYLISNDFRQRIEVWIEYFKSRREEIDKERAYFTKKWDKEDQNIIKVFQNTTGMYGDLQGLIGNALPKVEYLELPEKMD